jgi:chemotaxis protein MotA
MFAIIGIFVVLAGVIGGYIMEGGNLHVLFQPAELVIIGGAGLGSFLIAAPKSVIIASVKKLIKLFAAPQVTKSTYLDLLMVAFDILSLARREGAMVLESHVNEPERSNIFANYPSVKRNHEVLHFICDNIKVFTSMGQLEPHEFDTLMEMDIESHHTEALVPPNSLNKVADSLPGLGIVAAVLGVVLTMGKINEPPEVLGHSIGAALVGTFLGILMCYGFLGPMASNLEHQAREHQSLMLVVKAWLNAFVQGWPPALSVEYARRAVPADFRPTFEELEEMMRNKKKG